MNDKRRTLLTGMIATLALSGCAQLNLKPNDKIFLDADVLFEFGKHTLKPEGRRQIQQYVPSIKMRGETWVTVIGHTDRIGNQRANDALSLRRAEAVREVLVAEGLMADRVSARGAGSRNPVVECPDQPRNQLIQCLAPNRRVEINISEVRW
ncbi:MAG: OmpA family protein [Castellaniella sp.]